MKKMKRKALIVGERPKNVKMYNYHPIRKKNGIRKNWNKVFCIGLNKTGTTSLHFAFQQLGLCSFHGGTFDSRIDAFSDGRYYKQFETLDTLAPNSKFILNTRNLRDWIISRIKHCQRGHPLPDFDSNCEPKRIHEWVEQRWNLHQKIHEYFHAEQTDRSADLLVFNVSAGDGYKKLCSFLELPQLGGAFPRENTRDLRAADLSEEQINVIEQLVALDESNDPFYCKLQSSSQ